MGDRMGGVPAHPQQHAGAPLQPTFQGYIATTMDALILFEACLTGQMSHVPRRPHDRERNQLIVSGNVFIYEEHSSGIKRWTDGVPWSPSRILGNFLLYRELDKPFQPGEKKRAMKKNKENGVSKSIAAPRSNSVGFGGMTVASTLPGSYDNTNGRDAERALVGSLVDSYQFKQDGLVKKTISVQYKGMHHHLVSYYNIEDVVQRKLITPMEAPTLQSVTPRSQLISAGNFRAPVDDHEMVLDDRMRGYVMANGGLPYEYGVPNVSRSMSVPHVNYAQQAWGAPSQYLPQSPSGYSMHGHMSHGLPPPPATFPPPTSSSYSFDASGVPQQHRLAPQNYGQMSPNLMRRHSHMFDTNGSGNVGYPSPLGSVNRGQMNGTPLLPSSGSVGGHGGSLHSSFSNPQLFESATASNGPSQHGGMYEPTGTPRHHSGYDNGTPSQRTPSFTSHLSSTFDTAAVSQTTNEFESGT
ncbi:Gti1/Pac2 family-domain-containing protein [Pseudomassariella vexata]|uniref:Gti1/Pac2 family-domain-containing protein n=1 Tax=Pseudomassariella vexata TaxID=1141098 RepID=A0A1Y2ED21_9PEZI|nr:Gti1/Pac2 family-domain-containing protein [Pseudomassariella vexata]ORY69483.1 Gti1/Pac2 family-domain-containing protein [Pseudomassariella vexata]